MDKELLMVMCVFAGLIVSLIGIANVSTSDVNTYRLMLTTEGCAYASSIGLPIETGDSCAVAVRFRPNQVGSGGVIFMDNDKRLTISDSMLLASERVPIDLPSTPELSAKANWGLVWLAVGGLMLMFGLFIGCGKSRAGQKGGGE
jgi:hypothetical protein